MELRPLVACICEGHAEKAIIELLRANRMLIFHQMLEDSVIMTRSARGFEERYLRKGFQGQLSVVRILDSRRENFKLSALYKDRVDVINIVTAPEIEILIIHAEHAFQEYKKSGLKPSEFCKQKLNLKHLKSYDFVASYFDEIAKLLDALKQYQKHSRGKPGEYTLLDIIKKPEA